MTRGALAVGLLLAMGCGGDPPPEAPPPPHPIKRRTPVAALQPAVQKTKEAVLEEARKRPLTGDDFKESAENRDPFRSFLGSFAAQAVSAQPQHRILLDKFALEELKLIAIVGGDGTRPKAMFVDPSGMGVAVVRGDHVGKVDALVSRIAPDRVFFQVEERLGAAGKPKLTERMVELRPADDGARMQ